MVCVHDTVWGVGNAVSAGLGLSLGLILVPYMFQAMTPVSRIVKPVIVCVSCGGKNAEDFKFCAHCGRPVSASTSSVSKLRRNSTLHEIL